MRTLIASDNSNYPVTIAPAPSTERPAAIKITIGCQSVTTELFTTGLLDWTEEANFSDRYRTIGNGNELTVVTEPVPGTLCFTRDKQWALVSKSEFFAALRSLPALSPTHYKTTFTCTRDGVKPEDLGRHITGVLVRPADGWPKEITALVPDNMKSRWPDPPSLLLGEKGTPIFNLYPKDFKSISFTLSA